MQQDTSYTHDGCRREVIDGRSETCYVRVDAACRPCNSPPRYISFVLMFRDAIQVYQYSGKIWMIQLVACHKIDRTYRMILSSHWDQSCLRAIERGSADGPTYRCSWNIVRNAASFSTSWCNPMRAAYESRQWREIEDVSVILHEYCQDFQQWNWCSEAFPQHHSLEKDTPISRVKGKE